MKKFEMLSGISIDKQAPAAKAAGLTLREFTEQTKFMLDSTQIFCFGENGESRRMYSFYFTGENNIVLNEEIDTQQAHLVLSELLYQNRYNSSYSLNVKVWGQSGVSKSVESFEIHPIHGGGQCNNITA